MLRHKTQLIKGAKKEKSPFLQYPKIDERITTQAVTTDGSYWSSPRTRWVGNFIIIHRIKHGQGRCVASSAASNCAVFKVKKFMIVANFNPLKVPKMFDQQVICIGRLYKPTFVKNKEDL